MEFTTTLERFDSDLWGHHFPVSEVVGEYFIKSTGRRVVCQINGMVEMHCAIMQFAGGNYFINVNKKIRDKLGLTTGQKVELSLHPDESTYGLPISEEFEEVLRQDEVGSDLFHALTPGKQRTLIYYADNVKSIHIKLRRALVVMEHLKLQNGVVDFKALNEEMKSANRRETLR